MSSENQILKVSNLQISFEGAKKFDAVKNISFQVSKGKTLAIVGESGSGKSLTALSLIGLLPIAAKVSGSIELKSKNDFVALDQLGNNWKNIRGKDIGMVFQEPMSSLNPIMKVGKQLTESIIIHQKLNLQQAKNIAIEWLEKVQIQEPQKIFDRYPHQLSGGQKQRVMIAMAMCNHPILLIADEPTTALDVTVQMEVVKLMQDLQKQTGTAMIFITHDLALASTIADEVLVMYKGEVVEYGTKDKVLNTPNHPYTKALIACKPSSSQKGKLLPIVADFLDEKTATENTVIDAQPILHTITDEPLLVVNDLRIWFTENKDWLGKPLHYFKAVDDVSFQINKGEILGLVGESGCGKSTLSKSLIGLLPVKEGQIIFENKDLAKIAPKDWKEVRRKIQMIFQDPFASLNPRITIGDMLAEPLSVHKIVPKHQISSEVKRLLDLVQLSSDAIYKYPHQFSGGQRQRIGIARALALRPELIVCDESVSALDVSVQAQILNLLKHLQAEFDLSYLFISHDLSVVHYISDRVLVMQKGKIVESGDAVQVLKNPTNDYTKKLIASIPHSENFAI